MFARHDNRDYDLDPVASYRDYAVWCYKEMIETGACNYIYWDDVYMSGNFDLVPGSDAYRRADGAIQQANGVFNMRELIRRTAVMQTECGFESRFNWVHMTNTAVAPFCSFAGVNYDWEDIKGDKPLQESYPLDYMQALTCGRQMGVRVAVMGYFSIKDRNDPKLRWLEHTGTGACLVHEVQWTRVPEWRMRNDQLTAWGYRDPDTKVWNYWDEDVPFPVDVRGCENGALAMSRNGEAPCLNLCTPEQLKGDTEKLLGKEHLVFSDHEQYFYKDYLAYQADYMDKIRLMCRMMADNGYAFMLLEDLV